MPSYHWRETAVIVLYSISCPFSLMRMPRSGRPLKIDSRVEAHVTMIACSDPPEGYGRWTLHMIADKLVQLAVIDAISHESIRRTLKKTN